MPDIATRLHGPALVSNAAATKFTVSASEKVVVDHIHINNPTAATVNFTMSIGADAAATRLLDTYSIGPSQPLDLYPMYVLDAAEIFQAFAGTNNVLTLTIDGRRKVLG